MEMLTLHSFVSCGHRFILWTYRPLKQQLPDGVECRDASEIIPEERIFRYRKPSQFGHGKGSPAGFSDVFRYKLLYEHGGWWADMDVSCLKPLDFIQPYVFRSHHDFPVVGNLMKCPRGSLLMKNCYEEASSCLDENNTDWHKPIEILNNQIAIQQLGDSVMQITNQDRWSHIRKMLVSDMVLPGEWYAIHWVNVEFTRNRILKNYARKGSVYHSLLCRFNVPRPPVPLPVRLVQNIRLSWLFAAFLQLPSRIRNSFI